MGNLIVVCLILCIVCGFGFLIWRNIEWNNTYNWWSEKCVNDGGVVMLYRSGIVKSRYECIKDGEFINQID